MKVYLLHPDRDAPLDGVPPETADLVRDLGLDTLVEGMAGGDRFVRDAVASTLLRPLAEVGRIEWRQGVVADVLRDPEAARELYALATDAVGARATVRTWWLSDDPSSMLGHSVAVLQALLDPLRALRRFAVTHTGFRSDGLRSLVARIESDLTEDWFGQVEDRLRLLQFPAGVVLTARLGPDGTGEDFELRTPPTGRRSWRDALGSRRPEEYTYTVPAMDGAASQALQDLRNRGLTGVAGILAEATDHILAFFVQLRWEAAFLVGCVALHERVRGRGLPCALPTARPPGTQELTARGLYDVGLAFRSGGAVVGNDLDADGASLVVVTGANQGGKSTLLRGVGLAQLMMQAGMVVGAAEFRASVAGSLHTHFRREEDTTLTSGKLDEELARMSRIVDLAGPGDVVLLNESFASTNEREGSRIARQIVAGLTDSGLRVIMVTHLYEFSHGLAVEGREGTVLLRAERLPDGGRTFRVVPGDPLPTSHGADIWAAVFGYRHNP